MLKRRVLANFCRSPCIAPAAENTRSTPPARGGWGGKVLLDHLGKIWPLSLLVFPPGEHFDIEVRLLGLRLSQNARYCSSSSKATSASPAGIVSTSFLTLPRRSELKVTLRFLVSGAGVTGAGIGAGIGSPLPPGSPSATTGWGFHTVTHSVLAALALQLWRRRRRGLLRLRTTLAHLAQKTEKGDRHQFGLCSQLHIMSFLGCYLGCYLPSIWL